MTLRSSVKIFVVYGTPARKMCPIWQESFTMASSLRPRTLAAVLIASAGLFTSSIAAQAASEAHMPPGIVESLNNLAEQPATHTGFTFDRSEMQIAQDVLAQAGLPPDRAAAA